MPELYVVAGPNGAGKTTLFKKIIPEGIEYINADLIAKIIREKAGGLNTQDLANAEASKIFFEKVEQKQSFAIETNLYDLETYKSFLDLQAKGYTVNIVFLSVDDVNTCIARVAQRVAQGGHNVNPDVIKARYETGLKLLAHFKTKVNRLTILDNSSGEVSVQLVLENGEIVKQEKELCQWVSKVISDNQQKKNERPQSLEEARKFYKQKNKSKRDTDSD